MKIILSIILFSIAVAQPPEISIPNTVSFQGLLNNEDGTIYEDGEYEVTFKIIIMPDNGYETTIWQETHTVEVSNGVFSTYLGSINNFPNNLSSDAMLEIQVGNTILSPRQSFSSVPFAFKSQTASMSMQSQHSVTSDTASYIMNMPTIDSVQFSINSQYSEHADSSSFAETSNESNHSLTADQVLNPPPPISVYDDFSSPNNTNFFNDIYPVVVVDTIFEQSILNFYLQGLINITGNNQEAKTQIFFAPVSDFGENDNGHVYFLDVPNWPPDTRQYEIVGQTGWSSETTTDMNNPQIPFFFYIKPEFQNTPHRLVIRSTQGPTNMTMWGKYWGQ